MKLRKPKSQPKGWISFKNVSIDGEEKIYVLGNPHLQSLETAIKDVAEKYRESFEDVMTTLFLRAAIGVPEKITPQNYMHVVRILKDMFEGKTPANNWQPGQQHLKVVHGQNDE